MTLQILTIPKFLGGAEKQGKMLTFQSLLPTDGTGLWKVNDSEIPKGTETETFPYMHSEGHAVAHLIGVLPIPGHFAGPGIQVISPNVVINSSVPSALTVLILKEADYTRGKLKEELNCEEECNHRHCDSTYVKGRTCKPSADYTLQLLIMEQTS